MHMSKYPIGQRLKFRRRNQTPPKQVAAVPVAILLKLNLGINIYNRLLLTNLLQLQPTK